MALSDLVAKLGLDITNFQENIGGALSSLDTLGLKWDSIGSILAKGLVGVDVVGSITAIGIAAIDAGGKFETAFQHMVVGTGAEGTALDSLKTSLSEAFTSLPQSLGEVSAALVVLHDRLGATGIDLTALATQVGHLSAMSGEGLPGLADAVTKAFQNWGIAGDDLKTKMDDLLTVSESFGISNTSLATALADVGVGARLAGLSFEDAATQVGFLMSQGIDAQGVYTALARAQSDLVKSGSEEKITLKDLIFTLDQAKTEHDALGAAVKILGGKLGPQFYEKWKEGKLDDLSGKIMAAKASIEDTFGATETFGQKISTLKNKIEDLLTPLGKWILDMGSAFITNLSGSDAAIDALQTKIDKQQQTMSDKSAVAGYKASMADLGLTFDTTAVSGKNSVNIIDAMGRAARDAKTAADDLAVANNTWKKTVDDIFQSWKDETQAEKDAQIAAQNHADVEAAFGAIIANVVHPAVKDLYEDTNNLIISLGGMTKAMQDVTDAQDPAQKAFFATQQALIDLGVKPQADLEALAITAQTNFDLILSSGTATSGELLAAQKADLDAWAAYETSTYGSISTDTQQQMDDLKIAMGGKLKSQKDDWDVFGDGISKTMSKCSSDIIDGLFTGNISFGKVAKDFFAGIAKSFVDAFIKPVTDAIGALIAGALKDLLGGSGFGGILDSIKAIGTSISGVFKSAPSAPGVPSVPGESGAGGAGGIASAADPLTGWISAIGSAVTAISSVISNFQMAHLNNTINAMERETARAAIYLGDQAGNSIQYYTGKTAEIINYVQHRLEDMIKQLDDIRGPHLLDAIQFNTFWSLAKFNAWHPIIMSLGESLATMGTSITSGFQNVVAEIKSASAMIGQVNSSIIGLQPLLAGAANTQPNITINATSSDAATLAAQIVDALRQKGVIK